MFRLKSKPSSRVIVYNNTKRKLSSIIPKDPLNWYQEVLAVIIIDGVLPLPWPTFRVSHASDLIP
jgi:hypothetical protein